MRGLFEASGYKVNHVMNITDVGHIESDADAPAAGAVAAVAHRSEGLAAVPAVAGRAAVSAPAAMSSSSKAAH